MNTPTSPIKRPILLASLFQAAQRCFWHPLAAFLVASVALGALATWFVAKIPSNSLILPLLALAISYVPALVAVLVLRLSGSSEGWHAFRERLTA